MVPITWPAAPPGDASRVEQASLVIADDRADSRIVAHGDSSDVVADEFVSNDPVVAAPARWQMRNCNR